MTLLEEFKKFIKSIIHWIYAVLGFSLFFFIFGLKDVWIGGQKYLLPVSSPDSFSVMVFRKIEHDFLPPDVHLIVTNPLSAFVSQVEISLLIAFVVTFPFFLYKIIHYLLPALFPKERKAVLSALLPATLLFFGGCIFAYYLLIPATFSILFPYATSMGVIPFFGLEEFISSVLGLMIATGIMFLLPLFMIALGFLGIVRSTFWVRKWRQAIFFFLVFSAVITPDGTGITMALLFVPMALLYFAGCILTARLEKSKISL